MRERKTRILAVSISLCFVLALVSVGALCMVGFAASSEVPPEDISPPEEPVEYFEDIIPDDFILEIWDGYRTDTPH